MITLKNAIRYMNGEDVAIEDRASALFTACIRWDPETVAPLEPCSCCDYFGCSRLSPNRCPLYGDVEHHGACCNGLWSKWFDMNKGEPKTNVALEIFNFIKTVFHRETGLDYEEVKNGV